MSWMGHCDISACLLKCRLLSAAILEAFLEMGENWYQCLFRSPEMSFDRQLVNFVVIEEFLALSGVVMLDLLDLMTLGR